MGRILIESGRRGTMVLVAIVLSVLPTGVRSLDAPRIAVAEARELESAPEKKAMATTRPAGHLALPKAGNGRPVLVLHPWWGLNDTIKQTCQRLADEGYVAFAPDLYHGEIATTIPDAERLSGALFKKIDQARADVTRAADYVLERSDHKDGGLAVIGFSLGAFYALDLSARDTSRVRQVVVFYGTRPGDYAAAKAEYLGHFAEKDEYEPQSEVDGLEAALKKAGRPFTFHRYAGTGHWFFEPDVKQAYDATAAKLAWERTLAFLKH